MIDLKEFIDLGWDDQQKYDIAANRLGPRELEMACHVHERYEKIIEYLGHMIEEVIEARRLVPRRTWKKEEISFLHSDFLRKEFISEMFDILLFHRAVLAYAGVTGEEFEQVALDKYAYNLQRPDHNLGDDLK